MTAGEYEVGGYPARSVLCLCPNHHVQFDKGGFTINDDLTLNELDGRLTVHRGLRKRRKYVRLN